MATPIAEVLAAHARYRRRTALADNLGDGYLYAHNPMFRTVRERVHALGGAFSTHDWAAYGASPHTALPGIVRSARIPYVDNHAALVAIHRACPAMAIEDLPDLRRNHVFHEGAHVIAYRALAQKQISIATRRGRQQLALAALMGEAFATTCETIGAYHVASDVERALYRYNAVSYSDQPLRLQADLERAFALLGVASACRLVFFSFLCTCFLFDRLDDGEFATVLAVAAPDLARPLARKDRQFLQQLGATHCVIDLRFRLEFTRAHFQLLGLGRDIVSLVNFDFLGLLAKSPRLQRGLDQLVELWLAGATRA